jgi:hypothetical protein
LFYNVEEKNHSLKYFLRRAKKYPPKPSNAMLLPNPYHHSITGTSKVHHEKYWEKYSKE